LSNSGSNFIEQVERERDRYRDELDRVRQAANDDLQNWTAKFTGLMREINTLKTKLEKQESNEPEHDDTRELLLVWKDATGRTNGVDISPVGKRYALAKAGVKRWGVKRCEHALRGLGLQPWAGPRGRSATEYPGAKKYNDVEHALGDEVRMEKLEALWLAHITPSLLDAPPEEPAPPEREPESEVRQFVRYAYGDDCTLPYVPASRERSPRIGAWDARPPIDKVIGALRERDLAVVAHQGQPDSWSAQCPAHEDRNPSLSIHRRHDGVIGLNCFGGCDTAHVVDALGLDWSDLWANSEDDHGRADGAPLKRTLPPHLAQAMRDLLARDERRAA
jgi:Arc/MetJ-type ribon-helix-helix transcriptional regulator